MRTHIALLLCIMLCLCAAPPSKALDGVFMANANEAEWNAENACWVERHYIAAAGILLTVLLPWWMEGRLLLLRRVLGAASAVGLIVAGRCRRAGKCPLFLTHLAVCAFFVVHMLGNYGIWCSNPQLQDYWLDLSASALMALFAFYEAAFDVGLGRRRMQLATGLMAAYLGCAALSGSGYLILYFGCAVWALTDLCSLTPKPKQENAA